MFHCMEKAFSPITLSGIVSEDNQQVTTTELLIAVQLKASYYTPEGQPIDVVMACSKALSVNVIFGNEFFRSMRATIAYNRDVIKWDAIDCQYSFRITYNCPTMTQYP